MGHSYRLRLRGQEAWWFGGSGEELFAEREVLGWEELRELGERVWLGSEDEVVVRVEG